MTIFTFDLNGKSSHEVADSSLVYVITNDAGEILGVCPDKQHLAVYRETHKHDKDNYSVHVTTVIGKPPYKGWKA